VLSCVQQGFKEMECIAGFRLGIVAATTILLVLALVAEVSLPWVVAAYPVAAVAGLAVWYGVTSQRLRPRLDRAQVQPVLTDTLLYGGMYVASVFTFRQGIVILSFFRSGLELAGFAAGYRLLEVFSKVPLVLSLALVPEMFRSARDNPARLELLFRMQVRVLGLGVLPVAILIALFAPEIVTLIYGRGYTSAAPALRVFSAMLPLSFVNGALGDTLTTRDLQPRRTRIYLIVLVVGVGANVLLAWQFGAVGSAAALLLAEATLFALLVHSLRSGVTSLKPLWRVGRAALAALAAGALAFLLHGSTPVLVLVPAFLAVYVALCFALNALQVDEVRRVLTRLLHRGPGSPR
jgi:O-antigen/teichoic acid export membrane protein